MSKKTRRAPIGAVVRSRYQAPWYGVVVEHREGGDGLCVAIRRTHDRNGQPLRKTSLMQLSSHQLELVSQTDDIALQALERVEHL